MKKLFALATVMAFAIPATADEYVLTAKKWGKKQTDAVLAAGGIVTYSHAGTGIGVASSSNPDFLQAAAGSGAFDSSGADELVQWTPNVHDVAFDEASIGDDEPFFGIQWAPQAIEAPAAWDDGCTGAGVRVAILDGGIYDAHPDLAPNMDVARSASFVPGEPFNNDTGNFWHGTHVAGIVAAADNEFGVIGIAPEATLIGVKVLHSGSGSFAWVIQGILYAATPIEAGGAGADIINMSLGAVFPKNAAGGGPLVAAMNKAVNYAGSQGVLVVSAAGNDGLDLDHSGNLISVPAESGSGVSVSATGPVDFFNGGSNFERPASYTNYGNSAVNVAAPGGDFSLFPIGNWYWDMVLSTSRAGWSWAAGTSMASPAAAAVAAIIMANNPGISLGALKSSLQRSTTDEGKKGNDPFYGKGWVNAREACSQ